MNPWSDASCRRPFRRLGPFRQLGLLVACALLGASPLAWRLLPQTVAPAVLASSAIPRNLQSLAIENQSAFESFGAAVALCDDQALVGCPSRSTRHHADGAAFLLRRDPSGSWHNAATLTPERPRASELFGSSVAMRPHQALVGNCPVLEAKNSDLPSAYLFQENDSGQWRQVADFTLGDIGRSSILAIHVALGSDAVLVGRIARDLDVDRFRGDAYLFRADDRGEWRQIARLSANPNTPPDFNNFGASVALANQLAVIGASTESTPNQATGAVYLYREEPRGAWPNVARLLAADGRSGDCFGASVAVDGRMVLVGAPGADGPADERRNAGAAYLYRQRHDQADWVQVARLTPDDAADWDCFGASVALAGDIALVGAPGRDDGRGTVYAFEVGDNGDRVELVQVAKFTPPSATARGGFARAIALSNDALAAGAPWARLAGPQSGAAYWARIPHRSNTLVHKPPASSALTP